MRKAAEPASLSSMFKEKANLISMICNISMSNSSMDIMKINLKK